MKYKYPKGVDAINGFGGGYEATCQKMVIAGMKWFDEHPNANPSFRGCKGIFGFLDDNNKDAKSLSKAISKAADNDLTGAMHQACISHILYAKKNGWDKYLKEALNKNQVE